MDRAKDLWLAKPLSVQEGLFFRAEAQTAGRGRLGRTWVSKEPNFYATFVVRPSLQVDQIVFLSYATACALLKTLQDLGIQGAGLKWPNDVLIQGQKVAGILVEVIEESVVAIGVGVNFQPTDVKGALYPVTSLQEVMEKPPSLKDFSVNFLENLDYMIALCEEGEGQKVLDLWMASCVHMQKVIQINQPHGLQGLCLGLDSQGALCLQEPDSTKIFKIYAGDIAFLN